MNKIIKDVIQKVFDNTTLQIEELVEFLEYYFRMETNKEIDPSALMQLIQMHMFDMDHIIDRIGSKPNLYNIQIVKLYGKEGNFIRGYIYDL